jgi:benzoyl-CoA reductase/2-hydroxyglutaryl-CoA dehydratase subunit BcrC/BadD/HgdB
MMLQFYENTIAGLEARIAKAGNRSTALLKYKLEIVRLGRRLYAGEDTVAWAGVCVPFDLLSAMGVVSCFVEFVGAVLASTGSVNPMLEEAEQAGYPAESCGFHRAVIGAVKKGVMPVPDFVIASTAPCAGGMTTLENLAQMFGKDMFLLHIPQEQTERNVRILADRIKDMIAFVEAHTGKPMDEDRLRETIENVNRTRELMVEIYKYALEVPSPASDRMMADFGIVMPLLLGRKETVEVAEAYRNEFREMVKAGRSGVPGERLRLMWIQDRIQFKHPLIKMLEQEYKASIVVEELNTIFWDPIDPDDPYTGFARRALAFPFNGAIDHRVARLQQMAKDYRVDGAINPCHWGCRQGTGSRGLIQAALQEIDVPVVNLEVDCADPRNFSEGQLKTRLEAFAEMLESRTSPWAEAV